MDLPADQRRLDGGQMRDAHRVSSSSCVPDVDDQLALLPSGFISRSSDRAYFEPGLGFVSAARGELHGLHGLEARVGESGRARGC